MSHGNKYMVYSRDDGGRITRQHRTVVLTVTEIKANYPHHEILKGWPETEIVWSAPFGIATGVAPMSNAAKRAIA